jgi:hypothetical protein
LTNDEHFTPDEAVEAIGEAAAGQADDEERFLSRDDVADIAEQVGVPGPDAVRALKVREPERPRERVHGGRWRAPRDPFRVLMWAFYAFLLFGLYSCTDMAITVLR